MKGITILLLNTLLTAIACFQFCKAQNRELDSLSVILKKTITDTGRAAILKKMVFIWTDINPDTAINYINQLKKLGESSDNPGAVIYANVKMGEIYNMKGNFADAMKVNTSNLSFAVEKGTPYQQADIYKTIAMSYGMQEKNDSALHYFLNALKVYEDSRDSLSMAKVMVNMAITHDNMGDHNTAITFCKKAKNIFRNRDKNAYLVTLTNLALYQAYNKQYDDAEMNYKEALQIAREANNYNSQAHIYSGLTDVAYMKKQYTGMLPYARSFEEVAAKMQNDYVMLRAKLNMGKAMFFNKQFDKAESYFTEGLKLSDQLEDNALLKDIFGMYSYLLLSKYKNVDEFHKYRQKIDSLTGLENREMITRASKELEAKYETEKKDNQIKLQSVSIRQKQLWNYLLIVAVAALCIIGFISFRGYMNKQKLLEKEKTLQLQQIVQLEQEKLLTATQAVLQGQDEERSRLAKDLHDGLGGMLSGVKFSFTNLKENMNMTPENKQAFARNMDMLDGTIYELRRVAHNMMPESLMKFGLDTSLEDMCMYVEQTGKLHISYQSLGMEGLSVDKNIAIHIYRIVQELLNNIMKHSKATEALVQVAHSQGRFAITVEDNGSGFDLSSVKKSNNETGGMGWMNIQNRVDSLKGIINVQSSAQKGTSVFIEFNV